jgi:hypothetical protein
MFIAWLISPSFYIHLTLTTESFEKNYRCEQDVITKERMLFVLNVVYQGNVHAQVARPS